MANFLRHIIRELFDNQSRGHTFTLSGPVRSTCDNFRETEWDVAISW